jgi:adenosylmethionine-8-amino-7-oxononanoate aminotransferase
VTEFRYPAGHVFYRKLTRTYPKIVRGEGCYLFDQDGKRYLDAVGGAYVANIGHGVTEIADAIAQQAKRVAYVSGMTFTNEPVEALAAELAALSPGDLDKVYFLGSGSEAVEAALKLARQYWVETGKPGKSKIIALTPGYHGNTILALSASAREQYRAMYRDWLVEVVHIPAPYRYRCTCGGESPSCPVCSGAILEATIQRAGAETVAAFIAEPVGGSSTGANVPRPEYFRRVREICDRHQVLFIADEVLTGAGRTGSWSAIEQFGVVPDLMTLGKGITGGYVPLSAVVAPRRIVDPIARGSGAFLHAQTFSHHAVLCAASLAAVRYLKEHDLVARCARMGPVLQEKLAPLARLPYVGDVRGRGLLAGIEFVQDKPTKAPFPRRAKFAETFSDCAVEAGFLVWSNVGHADGTNGDLVTVAPPFIVTEAQIDELVTKFETALQKTIAIVDRGASTAGAR